MLGHSRLLLVMAQQEGGGDVLLERHADTAEIKECLYVKIRISQKLKGMML